MSIKEVFNKLINKKWGIQDVILAVLCLVIACILLTPILGIPAGIAAYFYFFYDDIDNLDEFVEKYDFQEDEEIK